MPASCSSYLKVLRRLDYIVTYMGMNQRHKPLDDPKVREAIACALNVEALQKAVWQGTGRVPNGSLVWEARYADHDLSLPVQDRIDMRCYNNIFCR